MRAELCALRTIPPHLRSYTDLVNVTFIVD